MATVPSARASATTHGPMSGGCVAAVVVSVVLLVGIIVLVVFLVQAKGSAHKSASQSAALAKDLARSQSASRQGQAALANMPGGMRALTSRGRSGGAGGSGSGSAGAAPAPASSPPPSPADTPTVGQVTREARADALAQAAAAQRASEYAAMHPAPAVCTTPGGGASSLAAIDGGAVNGSGKLANALAQPTGKSLSYMAATGISNTSPLDSAFGTESNLALYDPEGAKSLDAALSLTGTPDAFKLDDAAAEVRRQEEIIKAMQLSGKVDPTLEEVLGASAPFIATAGMLRRAVAAQSAVDREIVNQPPLRFLYQNPLWREATATPTISPILQDNITPGLDFYITTMACKPEGTPLTVESY